MKKRLFNIFSVLLIAVLISCLTNLSSDAFAVDQEIIKVTYIFEEPVVKNVREYDRIEIPGLKQYIEGE